ncbi:hypothetical protein BCY91_01125 [Pelobium manganitolerans]|uniref:Uncharacterized protein n=1 Tax=Pelobium manganitolerans TaxID=1842495 RepID=A0A419SC40_9SPHI|nr:hypothetical protein BCY91_01125 [Pelobium manganitolerans]
MKIIKHVLILYFKLFGAQFTNFCLIKPCGNHVDFLMPLSRDGVKAGIGGIRNEKKMYDWFLWPALVCNHCLLMIDQSFAQW